MPHSHSQRFPLGLSSSRPPAAPGPGAAAAGAPPRGAARRNPAAAGGWEAQRRGNAGTCKGGPRGQAPPLSPGLPRALPGREGAGQRLQAPARDRALSAGCRRAVAPSDNTVFTQCCVKPPDGAVPGRIHQPPR